jgi:outer membrane protein TolC
MGDLTRSSSQYFAVAPFISWRIFDGGTIKAQIHAAQARQEAAALAYEQAVLGALTDGERALSNYRQALEATEAQRGALVSARRTYQYAQTRYQMGDIALGELLDVERTLRDAEDGFARVQTSAAINLVALFKALGGGWQQPRPAQVS